MSYLEQNSYPDLEPDSDMVCPKCKDPHWGAYVWEMETEYDGDENGVYRSDYVTKWACYGCNHVFSEDEALSLSGVIEDDETPDDVRAYYKKWQGKDHT